MLRDSRGEVIAVNKSDIRTFLAGTERHIDVGWPLKIKGIVDQIDIMSSTNLFENSNFIKAYGSEVEKFQQYNR